MGTNRNHQAVAGMLLAAVLMLVSACGGKPYKPEIIGEMKPGPGLFTGKKGGLIISADPE